MKHELIETLKEYQKRFDEMGFETKVWNCGTVLVIHKADRENLVIHIEETYRHNGTESNVNIESRQYKVRGNIGSFIKGSKVKWRMDSSENVKNKRIAKILEIYEANK